MPWGEGSPHHGQGRGRRHAEGEAGDAPLNLTRLPMSSRLWFPLRGPPAAGTSPRLAAGRGKRQGGEGRRKKEGRTLGFVSRERGLYINLHDECRPLDREIDGF
jgi:hypothetical protein